MNKYIVTTQSVTVRKYEVEAESPDHIVRMFEESDCEPDWEMGDIDEPQGEEIVRIHLKREDPEAKRMEALSKRRAGA